MNRSGTFLAHALVDRQDRLLSADEPLSSFHQRCGGEIPGAIVTPGLLEIVRKSREFDLRLARQIIAQDDNEAVQMWVEASPVDEGTALEISAWQAKPLTDKDRVTQDAIRKEFAQHMSEFSAMLGPRQELLAVENGADELAALTDRMEKGLGQPWTDFVDLDGNSHHQPLHWRLLDGAKMRLDGSARHWTATLIPLGRSGEVSGGFELYLVADTPPVEAPEIGVNADRDSTRGIGLEIAPVLRQPVARIIANAETIRTRMAGPLSDEYSKYAADIATAGEHLLTLIEDLTALEVVEEEDFTPAPDEIDLVDVANRATGILGVRAAERGIIIDGPKAGESVPAIGEFRRVLQVMLNLLGNAIRYSPEGGKIWIRALAQNGRAGIVVGDQGEGLDEQQVERVFEKFERLGRTGDGGSGLGLYISRRLARAMGGSLSVDSTKGQGARFTLELPGNPKA